jgi:hypothetical protein
MSKLYQDAILDAKALRASAMANAKAALEEAFEPKIQEMLRLKLSEEMGDDSYQAEAEENIEEMNDAMDQPRMEGDYSINDSELEEILAELEELSKVDGADHDKMEEADEDKMKDENLNEAEEEEEEEEAEEEEYMGEFEAR